MAGCTYWSAATCLLRQQEIRIRPLELASLPPCPAQVFDSGCIGEGVLHILAAAQAKLLEPNAAMVPLSARVWCQPIQLRVGQVLGFDCSQANRWRWRPDYEGLELGRCRWAGGRGLAASLEALLVIM